MSFQNELKRATQKGEANKRDAATKAAESRRIQDERNRQENDPDKLRKEEDAEVARLIDGISRTILEAAEQGKKEIKIMAIPVTKCGHSPLQIAGMITVLPMFFMESEYSLEWSTWRDMRSKNVYTRLERHFKREGVILYVSPQKGEYGSFIGNNLWAKW